MTCFRWIATATVVAMSVVAYAQTDQGRFTGTVRDQSNAFVGAATVKVKNERTGEERVVLSNQQGYFLVGSLKPSTYTIRAEKDGFAPIEYTGMTVGVGQELSLDFEFKPAGVQEAVTVVGTAPVVDMSSARIGVNVGERDLNNLPVNGRQMSQLHAAGAGIQNSGTGTWQDIRFSGRAVEQNAIRYDGIEGSAIIDAAPGNLNGESRDALQAAGEPRERPGVPGRVQRLPCGVRYRQRRPGQRHHEIRRQRVSWIGIRISPQGRARRAELLRLFTHRGRVVQGELPKSLLKQNQFGGSFGGPIAKDRAFFFGSYEEYRLNAGINIVEAVPSAAAWARAVPAIAALRPGFLAAGAVMLPGKSTNPDFDIAQLQTPSEVRENAYSARFDIRFNNRWSSYVRVFGDQGRSDAPDSVSGRVVHTEASPRNAVFNLQGMLSDRTTNEFKFGYNAAPTRIRGDVPYIAGADFRQHDPQPERISRQQRHRRPGLQLGHHGAWRTRPIQQRAETVAAQPYDPYTLSFIDSLSSCAAITTSRSVARPAIIRMETDRLGGTTYSFTNLNAFLANQPSTIQYPRRPQRAERLQQRGDRPTALRAGVLHRLRAGRVARLVQGHVQLRRPLRLLHAAEGSERPAGEVELGTGVIDPPTTHRPPVDEDERPASRRRHVRADAPDGRARRIRHVRRPGTDRRPDTADRRLRSRQLDDLERRGARVSARSERRDREFRQQPEQPQLPAARLQNEYTIPERIWQYTGSMQQELGGDISATAAYIGSQGRNLFLRSIANPIVGRVHEPEPCQCRDRRCASSRS